MARMGRRGIALIPTKAGIYRLAIAPYELASSTATIRAREQFEAWCGSAKGRRSRPDWGVHSQTRTMSATNLFTVFSPILVVARTPVARRRDPLPQCGCRTRENVRI